MRIRRPSAFTLIELLVVIGIIAVLTAILLTSLRSVRCASNRARCLSNLRQLAIAHHAYTAEFPGWNTPAYWGWSPAGAGWNPNTPPPVPASGPRRHWDDVWSFSRSLNATWPGTGRYGSGLLCPDAPLAWERTTAKGYALHFSYAMNNTQLPGMKVELAPDYWNAWRPSQIVKPAEKIMMVDAVSSGVNANGTFNGTMRYFEPGWGERHEPPNKSNIVAYRHSRGANVLFHDGHALWMHHTSLRYDPAVASTARNKRQWEPTRP